MMSEASRPPIPPAFMRNRSTGAFTIAVHFAPKSRHEVVSSVSTSTTTTSKDVSANNPCSFSLASFARCSLRHANTTLFTRGICAIRFAISNPRPWFAPVISATPPPTSNAGSSILA